MDEHNTAEMVRSEEQVRVGTQHIPVERVRLTRSVVTEQRTVEVRREVLRVERELVEGAPAALPGVADLDAGKPFLEIVLSEEEVVTRVVPRERVRVFLDRTNAGEHAVQAAVRREVVVAEGP